MANRHRAHLVDVKSGGEKGFEAHCMTAGRVGRTRCAWFSKIQQESFHEDPILMLRPENEQELTKWEAGVGGLVERLLREEGPMCAKTPW